MKEELKHIAEVVTGMARPKPGAITVRDRSPHTFKLKDDGETPNNPGCPLLVYRSPVKLDPSYDPAAIYEVLFASHGWKDSWRDSMYDFNHFHTRTHEVLGIARGHVVARFGGGKGREVELKTGDVVAIPAGTGHRCLKKSRDLLIVGAYPSNGGKYDEPRPQQVDGDKARASIAKVRLPLADPVYGKRGPLRRIWA